VSRTLADRLPACRLLPNGVDDAFFASLPAPHPALADLPEPRAAYVGYLNERVDWDVLLRLMRSTFKGSLVLVGPTRTADPRLAALLAMPRVRALGWRGRVDTRAILAGCEVGLVPYVDDAFNRACHPLKYYEYAGCGLRVVSTPLPEAAHAQVPMTVASPQEFTYAVLASRGRLPEADRRRILGDNAWSRRADALCEMLEPLPACT